MHYHIKEDTVGINEQKIIKEGKSGVINGNEIMTFVLWTENGSEWLSANTYSCDAKGRNKRLVKKENFPLSVKQYSYLLFAFDFTSAALQVCGKSSSMEVAI